MTEIEERRLERALELQEAGHLSEALAEYRALAENLNDPEDRTGVLLYEINCLVRLGDTSVARKRLAELCGLIWPTGRGPLDSEHHNREICSTLHAKYFEAELFRLEGNEAQGLASLNQLLAEYPKHLGTSEHRWLHQMVQTSRAAILVELGRYAEAKPLLESVLSCEKDMERSSVLLYLGHCHYELKEIQAARDKLLEALQLRLPTHLEYRARLTLGLVYYEQKAYARAKQEFEACAQAAGPDYIAQARLWEWLAATCRHLGLDSEAQRYEKLARKE
jgi:tetratricopeptide (TPR) repeat protein